MNKKMQCFGNVFLRVLLKVMGSLKSNRFISLEYI